jgi:2-keto-4-pentenoate hydratase/2-oxohepta-3-ene-1,7-dioic acid hydratase in catechol pathway
LKQKGHPWEISKGFDGSAVLGTFFKSSEYDPKNIDFHLRKNGETVQSGNSSDMIFSFEDIITYASRFFKLQMGDLIYTGTPAGVGPIAIGDHLEGYLGNKLVVSCNVR